MPRRPSCACAPTDQTKWKVLSRDDIYDRFIGPPCKDGTKYGVFCTASPLKVHCHAFHYDGISGNMVPPTRGWTQTPAEAIKKAQEHARKTGRC